MLKAMLEQENKHLFLNIPDAHAGIIRFNRYLPSYDSPLLILESGNTHRAYYLPWKIDTGLYIDLPARPAGDKPVLFLTDNLSGCCVGIQNFGGFIRVRHYNLFTEGNHNPIFSQDDLFRYGTNISWLLPADKYNVPMINRAKPYNHNGPSTEAVLWGEYGVRKGAFTSKWHFYYQNGNSDTVIHELSYQ